MRFRHRTHQADGRRREIRCRAAVTAEQRRQGLMFREQLGEREGMLFVFEMSRTFRSGCALCRCRCRSRISDARGLIVHMADMVPCSEAPVRSRPGSLCPGGESGRLRARCRKKETWSSYPTTCAETAAALRRAWRRGPAVVREWLQYGFRAVALRLIVTRAGGRRPPLTCEAGHGEAHRMSERQIDRDRFLEEGYLVVRRGDPARRPGRGAGGLRAPGGRAARDLGGDAR